MVKDRQSNSDIGGWGVIYKCGNPQMVRGLSE